MSEARIAAYLRGELSDEERADIEAAMDAEPQWLGVLAMLAGEQEAPRDELGEDGSTVDRVQEQFSSRLHPGQHVGRFEIERPLGRGGMGSVYSAYDPKLRRVVALKILHASREEEQPRLVAEARALARVNHAHVITVHDVGRWEARVFVAMELLEGQTLQSWRRAEARTWREVLEVYAEAADGLAAAHEAGIVHRDVKPSNVMITTEGRVVVVDFGLAVEVESGPETPGEAAASGRSTRRAGTPAYMAPEQRRGEPATPASDQFGLCVALFEALTGELPGVSTEPGRSAGFDACVRIPARVMRVVERGLYLRDEGRYPSMRTFADALRTSMNTPLWPVGVAGACLLAAFVAWPTSAKEKSCTGGEEALQQVWTPERREAVQTALRAPGGTWSEGVAKTVTERVDGLAAAWLVERNAACEAGKDEDDTRLGAWMLCLDRRLRKIDALLTVFEDADLSVVSNATQAVDALSSPARCRDVTSIGEGAVRDPQVEAMRDQLAYAEALREAAKLEEADREVREALASIVALHDDWLEADARLVLGWVEEEKGRHDVAEEQLRLAVSLGTMSRNDRVVAVGLDRLAWVVGYKLGRHQEGRELSARAESWSARLEGPDDYEAYRATTLGWIEHEAGRPDEALAYFERAAEIARQAPPTDLEATYDLGLALNGMGGAHLSLGQLDEAVAAFERAGDLLTLRLGEQHPRVAQVLNNRASVLRAMARPGEALEVFERTRAVFETVYGPQDMSVGQTAANMAVVLNDLGRYQEGLQRADEAIRILSRTGGEDHPLVAKSYALRGDARIGLGEDEAGLRDLHRALAMETELLGPDHPSLGISQSNLSIAYDHLGRLEEAVVHQERALEILEQAYGEDHDLVGVGRMNLAFLERRRGNYERSLELYLQARERVSDVSLGMALLGTAEAYLLVERPEEAVATAREALSFFEGRPPAMGSRGDALFITAQARWAQGRRAEAKTLAKRALEILKTEDDDELTAEVEAWLRAPGPYVPEFE